MRSLICWDHHYNDVIMTTMGSQITSLTVVYSTVYSDADQRKHQSSEALAFVWGIQSRWIPCTKGQLCGKCFHLMTSSCVLSTSFSASRQWLLRILDNNYLETNIFIFEGPIFCEYINLTEYKLSEKGESSDISTNLLKYTEWSPIVKGRFLSS